ncbi:hypothetical protein NL676_026319 [Syzygium grande]|nr:hypothetical protein NL676_026319 [Syzygium grande]
MDGNQTEGGTWFYTKFWKRGGLYRVKRKRQKVNAHVIQPNPLIFYKLRSSPSPAQNFSFSGLVVAPFARRSPAASSFVAKLRSSGSPTASPSKFEGYLRDNLK